MNLTRLSKPAGLAATLCLMTACSSNGSGKPASGIGAPVTTPKNAAAVKTAALGTPITAGDLTMTISGPTAMTPHGVGLAVTFQVSMTNKNASAQVKGPLAFAVSCNGTSGEWLASSTAGGLTLGAGQTQTGTADVLWLEPDSTTQCHGATTIDAEFGGFNGNLSWTIPEGQVATVNTAAADVPSAAATS